MAHYEAGRYAEAAEKFKLAHEAEGKPLYLFTWAQAEVGRDDCRTAVGLFRRYLDTNPPEQNKKAAEARMATCSERLAALPRARGEDAGPGDAAHDASATAPEAAAPFIPAPAYVPTAPASAPPMLPPDRVEADPWYTDPVGMVLLGTGLVATGVGTGFLVASYSKESDLKDGAFDNYDEHQSKLDSAGRQRLVGGIASAAGVTLMAVGVVRLLTRDTSPQRPRSGFWIAPHASGPGATAGATF